MAEQTAAQDVAQPTDSKAIPARPDSLLLWPSVATYGGGVYHHTTLTPSATEPVSEIKPD